MNRYLSAAVAAAFVIGFASTASAADAEKKKKKKDGPDIGAIFAKLDANSDGKVDAKEFAAFTGLMHGKKGEKGKGKPPEGAAERREELFKKLDANKDGSLTLEEFSKVKELAAKKKKKKEEN